jgi:hypothetical protein
VNYLRENPGLEAQTLFNHVQRKYPGQFQEGQLRSLQRKIKKWRALEGPGKEVYFPQNHEPGDLSSSDFTNMNKLYITIAGIPFDHLLYHFVLTYSNWETGTICFSENFESMSAGMQNALWQLGGVCRKHRSDNLSAAVYHDLSGKRFTVHYEALLKHYGLEGSTINAGCAHENGDVEQSHNRFKKALDQALMLRGSRDFSSRQEYEKFIEKLFNQRNMCRRERFLKELKQLKRLPARRLDDFKRIKARVGPGSTISINRHVYSVPSRLIGEEVEVRLSAEMIEVWYGQKMIDRFARLHGQKGYRINYRHIIDWLIRKPGAFENYRYRDELFPSTRFRMAYDSLKERRVSKAVVEYLGILGLAAKELEAQVDNALQELLDKGEEITLAAVEKLLADVGQPFSFKAVQVKAVDLSSYDLLLSVVFH